MQVHGSFQLSWDTPEFQVFALLAAGHVLADFVLWPNARTKDERWSRAGLAKHVAVVGSVQGASLSLGFPSIKVAPVVLAIALVHLLIEAGKLQLDKHRPARPLSWLLLEQALHLLILAVASVTLIRWWPSVAQSSTDHLGGLISRPGLAQLAVLGALLAFNVSGGAAIVGTLLRAFPRNEPKPSDVLPAELPTASVPGAGRMIGVLERWLVLGLVWAGQWGAVGLVLTAKSVARFKRMEDQNFAEVYLVGTMTSVLVAILCGVLLSAAFGPLGGSPSGT